MKQERQDLSSFLVRRTSSLSEIITQLNLNRSGIVLVVDGDKRLIGTVTDGDVRRALLAGTELTDSADEILSHKDKRTPAKPLSVKDGDDEAEILSMMLKWQVHQIPVIDDEGVVQDIVLLNDIVQETEQEITAVLMAGGFGKRLMPMTAHTPKPMLEIGGRPIMERILEQMRDSGVERVSVSTHFQPEKISNYFGTGEKYGLQVDYVHEDNPLGTAGALALLPTPKQPLLVMNADILTDLDFRMFASFHRQTNADMSVAVRRYQYTVPYGVLDTDDVFVTGLREKPKYNWMINAGIYFLNPEVFQYIPRGSHFDMTDLIDVLIENDRKVACFPLVEYWKDIGRPEDFKEADMTYTDKDMESK